MARPSFFSEWKRRKVSRAVVVYVVAGLGVIEAANNILPNYRLEAFLPVVITLVLLGFPVAVVLSWVFEITSGGIKRTSTADPPKPGESGPDPDVAIELPDGELEPEAEAGLSRVHERRHVIAVAAQIDGYISLSEILELEDFESVKGSIGRAAKEIVSMYDGCIFGFSGEVLTLFFGLPRSHEDDAVRAVRAAQELRRRIREIPLPSHSNSGVALDSRTAIIAGPLVVEGCFDGSGTLDVTGDVHLLAMHLAESAKPGSLLVGNDVQKQADGHFEFEDLPPVLLQGRSDPVEIARFTAPRTTPSTLHGRAGINAPMVGRKLELQELQRALDRLHEGRGTILGIAGPAGTGKSRLVSEFKEGLDLSTIQWVEGHAFPYSESIPYSVIIDLLGRVWGIEGSDNASTLRKKVVSGVEELGMSDISGEPFLGSLFALDYPELENIQPETWRERVHAEVLRVLSTIARVGPTVFFLEDLHWTDGASLQLIRYLAREFRSPAILLCAYRPGDFQLFPDSLQTSLGSAFREVELQELSSSEAHLMVQSLLDSQELPEDLTDFLAEKTEGNPFFIEEAVHSLVEKGALVRLGRDWSLSPTLDGFEVPSTVQGLLLSRVDRLETGARKTLQEASVIGRVFPLRLLKRVTEAPADLQRTLSYLEESGLIHLRKGGQETEYIFHHALGQEVVYGTLVRRDRRRIHRTVGLALEELFEDRIGEFLETLAYHFRRGHASLKAVRYLSLAGEKSWRRYSLEEAGKFFSEAFHLLLEDQDRTPEEDVLLLSVLNRWAIVFNHLGDYRSLERILRGQEELARASAQDSPAEAALFFGWVGYALQCREELAPSYEYLKEALALAERAEDRESIAYVSAWMTRTCVDMGRLEEALEHGNRAEELAKDLPPDAKLFRFTFSALGLAHYFRGDRTSVEEVARKFLSYGERHTDLRSLLLGHVNEGCARIVSGDYAGAVERLQDAIGVSVDPMYSMFARLLLGVSYASMGKLSEAEETLNDVVRFDAENDFNMLGTTARGMLSIALLSRGDLSGGVSIAEEVIRSYEEKGNRYRHALQEYMLGSFYLRLLRKEGKGGVAFMAKNIGFLLRNLPHAEEKARGHLSRAVEIAGTIGAHGVLGQSWLALGQLNQATGDPEAARMATEKARAEFEWCGAQDFLHRVEEVAEEVQLIS